MRKIILAVFVSLFSVSLIQAATCRVEKTGGSVSKVDSAGSRSALSAGGELAIGETISTSGGSFAVLAVPDGSKIRVAEKTEFKIDEAGEQAVSAKLSVGRVRSLVSKLAVRKKFDINTPTTVCSVRGTDFEVTVGEKGKTTVHVFEGLVSARQAGGEEIMIHQNQGLSIEENMAPEFLGLSRSAQASFAKAELSREVGLDMSREQVLAAAALEMRNAEYQEGKSLVDVFGKRVRVDEYVLRPQANQFKMVVLNDRDDRFDFFTYKATFDSSLPATLSDATSKMFEADAIPACKLVSYEKTRSNTQDSVVDTGSMDTTRPDGGYISDGGKFKAYFKDWLYRINGKDILSYVRTGYASQTDLTFSFKNPDNNVTTSYVGNLNSVLTSEASIDGLNHDRLLLDSGTGFWSQEDSYIFDDAGKIATHSQFNPATATAAEQLKWNYQTVFTCSLFGGRKIDLVIEPKIMQNTGISQ